MKKAHSFLEKPSVNKNPRLGDGAQGHSTAQHWKKKIVPGTEWNGSSGRAPA
jgi:hypothetical protein